MSISDTIKSLHATLPPGVKLVAVSKFHPAAALREAYDAGQRIFGESRAAELVEKAQVLPDDIRWHFIGHLQTNKVRAIMPYVDTIESIDSERLLHTVQTEAERIGRDVDVLLQVHVAMEDTKFGLTPEELMDLAKSGILGRSPRVTVRGVMGMASNVDDNDRIRADFRAIHGCFDTLRHDIMADAPKFDTISMGMSHDYMMAIEEGTTMVRIGTTIFGERQY